MPRPFFPTFSGSWCSHGNELVLGLMICIDLSIYIYIYNYYLFINLFINFLTLKLGFISYILTNRSIQCIPMYNWSRLRTTFEAQFTDTISLAPISVWMNSWQLSQAHAGMSCKPAKYDIKIWCDCNIPVAYTQLKYIIHTLLVWLVHVLCQNK